MFTFKTFLEAKKKASEPQWFDDYASGYSRLRDIQNYLHEKNIHTQLFVPKRRDPEIELERKRTLRYNQAKREVEDSLKEEHPPILTAYSDSPVSGDNKPSNAFWTSTASKKSDGSYTSDWYEFVKSNFPSWQTDYGYIFEVDPKALVLGTLHLEQFYEWAEALGKTKDLPDSLKDYFRGEDKMRFNFPWDLMSRYFDGVRHTGYPSDFTYGWDVESTAWFNTKVLKYKGAVKLWHGIDED